MPDMQENESIPFKESEYLTRFMNRHEKKSLKQLQDKINFLKEHYTEQQRENSTLFNVINYFIRQKQNK